LVYCSKLIYLQLKILFFTPHMLLLILWIFYCSFNYSYRSNNKIPKIFDTKIGQLSILIILQQVSGSLYVRAVTHWTFLLAILRHCHKKILRKKDIFQPIFFPVCIEIFFLGQLCLLKPTLKIFWNVNTIFLRKKYLFIKMSFYLFITILCSKMPSVYKP
jgi:hypothetical protein